LLPAKLIQLAQNNVETVLEQLNTSSEGLSELQSNLRLGKIGLNEIAHEKPRKWYVQFLKTFAPDLCWARKPNIKMGIGINMEQGITDDIGVFFRGMYSDGKTEVYSYTSADRSISFGAAMKGIRWGRRKDTLGIGYAQSWISSQHVAYLNMGGVDGFIGDGKINYRPDQVADIYYQWHAISSTWVTFDYQHLANPAFNADRGPVDIYNARIHFEF
jgi:hypothetical protein